MPTTDYAAKLIAARNECYDEINKLPFEALDEVLSDLHASVQFYNIEPAETGPTLFDSATAEPA
jgi:hypothetical protein